MSQIHISGSYHLHTFFQSVCDSIFLHILQSRMHIVPHSFTLFQCKYHCLPERSTTAVLGITSCSPTERFTLTLTFMPSNNLLLPFTRAFIRTIPFSSTSGLISLILPLAHPCCRCIRSNLHLIPPLSAMAAHFQSTVKSTSIFPALITRQKGSEVLGILYLFSKRLAITPSKGAVNVACSISY